MLGEPVEIGQQLAGSKSEASRELFLYAFSELPSRVGKFNSEVKKSMKIQFQQSGGFAGLIRGCEIDTQLLSPDEAAQLQSLVRQSGILQLQSQRTENAADLFNYEIVIETEDGNRYSISSDDNSLPQSVKPLLEYLQSQCQPIPLR